MPRMRGAIPTSRAKLAAAFPFRAYRAIPASFGYVPTTLNLFGNDTYGDCVTAEECASKGAYSAMLGLPDTLITYAEAVSWARAHGYLNGADLPTVMATMATDGIVATDGKTYTDGGYASVDYTVWATLCAAIAEGPVKIGIGAGPIEGSVTSVNGWVGTGWSKPFNQDHCTALWGYGTFEQCFGFLGMPVPSGQTGGQWTLFFTWGTVGVVDYASVLSVCGEAWLRTPTTVGQTPVTPPSPGPPIPAPPMLVMSVNLANKQVWAPTNGWTLMNP